MGPRVPGKTGGQKVDVMPSLAKQILLQRIQNRFASYPHYVLIQGQVASTATWRQLRRETKETAAWLSVHAISRRLVPPAFAELCQGPTIFWGARTPEALWTLVSRVENTPGWILLGGQVEGRAFSASALRRAVSLDSNTVWQSLQTSLKGSTGYWQRALVSSWLSSLTGSATGVYTCVRHRASNGT